MKTRIVKKTYPDGIVMYTIQQKHFLFRWLWVDAWINSSAGAVCLDSFLTLEEAKRNLCYFDGTKTKIEVVEND